MYGIARLAAQVGVGQGVDGSTSEEAGQLRGGALVVVVDDPMRRPAHGDERGVGADFHREGRAGEDPARHVDRIGSGQRRGQRGDEAGEVELVAFRDVDVPRRTEILGLDVEGIRIAAEPAGDRVECGRSSATRTPSMGAATAAASAARPARSSRCQWSRTSVGDRKPGGQAWSGLVELGQRNPPPMSPWNMSEAA